MNILLSTCSFAFSETLRNANLVEVVRKIFSEEFPNVTTVNIPENAPAELPRFILLSHHGFSTVVITSNLLQLTTKFSEDYSLNWNGFCKPYLETKLKPVYTFLDECAEKIKYSGLTINSIFQTEENAVKLLGDSFIKQKVISNLALHDVMQKQTFGYKDKYFVNLQIQNQRYPTIEKNGVNPVFEQKENDKAVSIVLDINDRQIANKDCSYISSKNDFDEILCITEKIINFGLEKIIGGSSICLN